MEMLQVLIVEKDGAVQAAVQPPTVDYLVTGQSASGQSASGRSASGQSASERFTAEQMLIASQLAIETCQVFDLATATVELENHSFDCILLDTTVLEKVSLQLLHELKMANSAIPIVVIIDQAESQTLERWQQAGVNEILQRASLTPAQLAQTLRYVIRLHRAEQQAAFAAQRLRQNDQLLLRQYQTIEQQEQQIQQLSLQLLETAQFKSHFLATVSHELRTPLNAIIGFSQLLQRGQASLNSRQADMVSRILVNARHLLTSINEILTLARIEAGQLNLQQESISLVHLIRSVIEELQGIAAQKHLQLNVHLDLPNPRITTDPTHLQQILFNLISNAVKFTASGSITVEAREIGQDQLLITVEDTGVGIKPADLEHIFEPFWQVDQTITRSHRGIGLGLTLTAALVQQIQGKIRVKSNTGKGTQFCIELPRKLSIPSSTSATKMTASIH